MGKIKIPTPVEPTIESELRWLEHFKKICITYWYPKIADLSPETYIIDSELTFKEQFHIAEGKFIDDAKNKVDNLIKEITKYSEKTGVPFFLRTGQTSAKHYWLKTCYVQDLKHLYNHIYEIMEFSMMVDLPANIWVVRKIRCKLLIQ